MQAGIEINLGKAHDILKNGLQGAIASLPFYKEWVWGLGTNIRIQAGRICDALRLRSSKLRK
jgi:hypothetical protein